MKRYGKIALGVLLTITIVVMLVSFTAKTSAAVSTYTARSVCITPIASSGLETNFVLILMDADTGNLIKASDGTISASNTWTNAAFIYSATAAAGKWTKHTISDYPVIPIPALPKYVRYVALVFDSASPVKTDVPTRIGFYDPESGSFYDDTVPTKQGASITTNKSTK